MKVGTAGLALLGAVLGVACTISVPEGAGFELVPNGHQADAGAPTTDDTRVGPNGDGGTATAVDGGAPATLAPPALCASLLQATQPDGKLDLENDGSPHLANLIDVYVRESDYDDPRPEGTVHIAAIDIVFTSNRHTCSFLANDMSAHDVHQTTVALRHPMSPGVRVPPGTYGAAPADLLNVQYEDGKACLTNDEIYQRAGSGDDDTRGEVSLTASVVPGTVTITKHASDWIEGSVDVVQPSGQHLKGTFAAPICPTPNANWPGPYCCYPRIGTSSAAAH